MDPTTVRDAHSSHLAGISAVAAASTATRENPAGIDFISAKLAQNQSAEPRACARVHVQWLSSKSRDAGAISRARSTENESAVDNSGPGSSVVNR